MKIYLKEMDYWMNASVDRKEKIMLKIKDEVDLKELEKFGFREDENDLAQYKLNLCKEDEGLDGFIIYSDDREINNYTVRNDNLDILYDLIQADLVEKI